MEEIENYKNTSENEKEDFEINYNNHEDEE